MFQCWENNWIMSSSVASKGRLPAKTLLGSMNFLVPGLPAVWRRSLLSSIRWDDLEVRPRLFPPETFIVSVDDDDDDDDDDVV